MNRLSNFTTLRVGGPAQKIVHAHTEDELIQFVKAADEAKEAVLILGGGSNLLISDAGLGAMRVQTNIGTTRAPITACAPGETTTQYRVFRS